jgi:CubicO group peptidase (beta-lactamase class C family)
MRFVWPLVFLICVFSCGDDSFGSLSDETKKEIRQRLRTENFQGIVLISKGKEILMRETIYNKRGDRPRQLYRKHSFPLGESTKPFTTYALKILLLEKNIKESAYVKTYLPWFPYPTTRIQNLLKHTSGLPKILELDPNFDSEEAPVERPKLKELFAKSKIKPSFPEGEYWKYTRLDYFVLAYLIEKISGKSYPEYVKEKIFSPLHMEHSYADSSDPVLGNSGIYTNPEDLVLWKEELSHPTLLFNKQVNPIFERTILTDAVSSDPIFFGEGAFVGDYFHWTYGKQNGISNFIYQDRKSDILICIVSPWGGSKGDLSSFKSIITEVMFGGKRLKLREPVKSDKEISIEDVMKEQKVPAVGIAVYKNHSLAWKKNFGVKNLETGEKVTDHTLFRAGSLSKTTIVFTTARLIDDKIFDPYQSWNGKLRKYHIGLQKKKKGDIVNLDQLLSHTSGLTERGNWDDPINKGKKHITEIKDTYSTKNGNGLELYYRPGSKSRYSGGGYAVIQEALVDVMKMNFPAVIERYVAHPLKWKDSTFRQNLTTKADYCEGHDEMGKLLPQKKFITPELGSGGLWTTPEEIGSLFNEVAKANLGQSELLSERVGKFLLTPKMSAANLTVHALAGRGFFINRTGSSEYFFHGGHTKGHKALAFFNSKKGYGIVILTNAENGSNLIWRILRSVSMQEKWDKFVN